MRRDKVLRFLGIAFALGAFLGLVSGLAFGGTGGSEPPRSTAAEETGKVAASQEPSDKTSSSFVGPMTADKAEAIGANELGQILVLSYRDIGEDEDEDTRAPENLAKDIELLRSEGFYPINVRDLASGNIDIPAGMSPVVLTFDDSTSGQYRILDDGSIDPDSAVGILQAAAEEEGWDAKATFYCLLDVASKDKELFGQPDRRQEKLRNLVDWGYEVGSHTITNLNLQKATTADVERELAQSKSTLEELIGGGYSVTSLSVPAGDYPEDESILSSGNYSGDTYKYTSAVTLGDTASPSPFSTKFRAMHIPRIIVTGNALREAIAELRTHPELRYISDGDRTTVSAPREVPEELGELRADLGRPVIRY
jgi:peptidoglycan/xylan/chitin deacetylase (PgdA/CDA1 family)